jgi:transposase-like protein
MKSRRPPLFRKRQFEPVIIVTCVRWYLRFPLSARDVEALIAERGLSVDHTDHNGAGARRLSPEIAARTAISSAAGSFFSSQR